MTGEELSSAGERDPDFVQSLQRGLAVLTAFDAEHASLTLSDVARRTGITRAAARRFLHTFQRLGYMRSDGRHFELTPRVLDLGHAYVASTGLADIAQPYMEALSERFDESVSLAVLDGFDIVYVARVATKHVMSISLGIGSRLPAAITSMGRAILASMTEDQLATFLAAMPQMTPRTARTLRSADELSAAIALARSQGYAVVDEELEDNVRSIAVALRNRSNIVVGALNIGTSAARVPLATMHEQMHPALAEAADAIRLHLARR